MDKPRLIPPTDEEDTAINQGIALDPDTVEWTDAEFAAARPASEACPGVVEAVRLRGPQRAPTKELISLRVDREVLERWRATGPGWQGRINELLRKAEAS